MIPLNSDLNRRSNFKKIYHHYFRPLLIFAKKYVKSEEIAKDVVTDVFLNLWNYNIHFDNVADAKGYLYKATKNQCIKYINKSIDNQSVGIENDYINSEFTIENFTPEDIYRYNELKKKIDHEIETLPPRCKIIFKHLKEDGLKYKEVADILDISREAVKKQLIKAMGKIRMCIVSHLKDQAAKSKKDTEVIPIKKYLPIFF